MARSHETRAWGMAVLSAATSLGMTWLAAIAIQKSFAGAESTMVSANTVATMNASPDAINQGSQFYAMSCSHCHSEDATGDEGPSLHNLTISNGRIATTIKKGIKGEMPSFAKKYNDQEIAALVSYLRSLR